MGVEDLNVGAGIRACRKRAGLSLLDLSRRTGIAASNLSSIELNKTSPTINTLVKIAAAFGLKAGAFLDETLYRSVVPLNPFQEPEGMPTSRERYGRLLTEQSALNRMDALRVRLESGADPVPLGMPGTDRILWCLEGEVVVEAGGESHLVDKGSGLYLFPDAEASVQARGVSAAELLVISTVMEFRSAAR